MGGNKESHGSMCLISEKKSLPQKLGTEYRVELSQIFIVFGWE